MEKPITNEILNYLNKYPGCFALKRLNTGMTGTTGFADISGVVSIHFRGIHIEIEVKYPGEEPSELQLSRLRMFRELGCISFWCDSVDSAKVQFLSWLEFLKTGERRPSDSDIESCSNFRLSDLEVSD